MFIQESANLLEIKAREKLNRRHRVDIPRIQFFAQRRYLSAIGGSGQFAIYGWSLNGNRRGKTSTDFGKNGRGTLPDVKRWDRIGRYDGLNGNTRAKGIDRPFGWTQRTKLAGAGHAPRSNKRGLQVMIRISGKSFSFCHTRRSMIMAGSVISSLSDTLAKQDSSNSSLPVHTRNSSSTYCATEL